MSAAAVALPLAGEVLGGMMALVGFGYISLAIILVIAAYAMVWR